MKQLQVLSSEYGENIKQWSQKGIELIFINDWKSVDKSIPVLCYADLLEGNVRHWLNNGQLAIYAGRGYVGNHLYKKKIISSSKC